MKPDEIEEIHNIRRQAERGRDTTIYAMNLHDISLNTIVDGYQHIIDTTQRLLQNGKE